MKNFNKILMAKDIKEDILEVREATLLLVAFDEDPDTVVANILNTDHKDLFLDIDKGLRNEYTRDKALVLGRAALKKVVENIVEDIKEDTDELLAEYTNNIKNVIDVNIEALDSIDIETLSNKLETIITNPVRVEYLKGKIDSIINPKLASDTLSEQKNIDTFLTTSLNRLTSIDDKYIVTDANSLFKKTTSTLLSVFKDIISKDEVIDDIAVEDVNDIIELTEQHEMLMYTVNESETVDGLDDVKLFIDVTKMFLTKLKSIKDLRNKLYGEVEKVDFMPVYEFAKIYYDETLVKYTDGKIDKEILINKDTRVSEFEAKLDIMFNNINNAIVVDMNKLNNDLAILDQLSDILVEVIYSTIPK